MTTSDRPGVDGYDVVALLGRGGSGEVWLARERATGDPVALKRLLPGADPAALERARREALVLSAVEHPHLVRLRRVVPQQDEVVLVLDHAAGGSLTTVLGRRERLTPGEVVTLATPLAQALGAVHARGVVHGDITPGNVLFTSDGRPLLADLGVARLLGEGPREVEGTRAYVAPEVLAGRRVTPAADVHALAAVCVTALTGAAAGGRRAAEVDLPSTVPAGLARVLRQALRDDAEARPDAATFATEIFRSASPEPIRLDVEASHRGTADVAGSLTRVIGRPALDGAGADRADGSRSRRRRSATRARHRHWRPVAAAIAVFAGLAAAAGLGVVWAGADRPAVVALPDAGSDPEERITPRPAPPAASGEPAAAPMAGSAPSGEEATPPR